MLAVHSGTGFSGYVASDRVPELIAAMVYVDSAPAIGAIEPDFTGAELPLPGMPQFPEFDVDGGFTGLDTEKFRLPGKEDYKAPRNFREEILDSLKQGVPRQMKEQIERYFKNLSE